MFVGRQSYFATLKAELAQVRATGRGNFVLVRGRRQVGKSRLLTEFLKQAGVPSVYYQATKKAPERELAAFTESVAASSLTCAAEVRGGVAFKGWGAALSLIARTADRGSPAVIVLDEVPYLMEGDQDFEPTLQKSWDHDIQDHPVLLIIVGSDLAMMRALTTYGRPLYGRPGREISVEPLSPREIADLRHLSAVDAFDAYLVTGGFPRVAVSAARGQSLTAFLAEAFSDAASPLVVIGERMLNAEFPSETNARTVLQAVGAGERAFTSIANAAGFGGTSLHRALGLLETKGVVARDSPLSTVPQKKADRYRVEDPYLRFWLRFVGPALPDIERGRGDLVMARFRAGWESYRGRAIEPLCRQVIERMCPDRRFGDTRYVAGYWNRINDPEVDLVGTADRDHALRVEMVGSIRWRDRKKFDVNDARALVAVRPRVPGSDEKTRLVAVSRAGVDAEVSRGRLVDTVLGPAELLKAF